MTASKGKVIFLHQRDPQEALERLNRITGLHFSHWPQSLCSDPVSVPPSASLPAEVSQANESAASGEVLSG